MFQWAAHVHSWQWQKTTGEAMKQRNECSRGRVHTRQHNPHTAMAAALGLALTAVSIGAHAATQLVTNCNDAGSGSMRAAIGAAISGDVVDASGLTCSSISLSTGALAVTVNDLAVRGPGATYLTVTNGAKYGRVIRHEGTGVLNLYGLTVTGGAVSPNATEAGTRGGCIYSAGTVNLGNLLDPGDAASGVVVSDCTAVSTQANVAAEGGGIFSAKGVGLSHSVVTHSRAVAQDQATLDMGGGIATSDANFHSSFAMKYSEVSQCSATGPQGSGGGISAPFMDTVTILHSTIADNVATAKSGGAYIGSHTGQTVQIDNSTVSGNTSGYDGGLRVNVVSGSQAGLIKMYATTITDNQATTAIAFTAGAWLVGPALIESTIAAGNFVAGTPANLYFSNLGTAGNPGSNNLVGVASDRPSGANWIVAADPGLGLLANHGGFTRTHLLLANSQAVNAGNNNLHSTNEQRGPGFQRVIGSAPDIGATEFDPDRIFNNGFD
jgi:hypothetical protein